MDSIFFPLKSNAGWFEGLQTREQLEKRIKRAMVIHDELIFEDGRYQLIAWENGRMEFHMSPGSIPGDRDQVQYFQAGDEFGLAITDPKTGEVRPILDGPTVGAYEVDFFPILRSSGLLDRDYTRTTLFEVSEDLKQELKKQARNDIKDALLMETLEGEHFQRSQLVESFHLDSSLAQYLGTPFVCEPRVVPFVEAKNRLLNQLLWRHDLRPFTLETLIGLVLPDFSTMDWGDLDEIRESQAGRDLRRYLNEAARQVIRELANFDDARDLEILLQRYHLRELAAELVRQTPDVSTVSLGILLNLLPLGGLVGSAAEASKLIEHNGSWISLVRSRHRNH